MENKIAKKQKDLLSKDHIDEVEEYTRENDLDENTMYDSPKKNKRNPALNLPLDINSS